MGKNAKAAAAEEKPKKRTRRALPRKGPKILFPTEPTSIDPKLITRAIEEVIAARKKS